jgi:hypothetical protein
MNSARLVLVKQLLAKECCAATCLHCLTAQAAIDFAAAAVAVVVEAVVAVFHVP